jgi:peptidoglycan/LPS O-acetylase OafA/YrhL
MSDPQPRYQSLDGLRGIAALTVIGYHALLIIPSMSTLYIEKVNPTAGSIEWWLYKTPLRLLFAGHEAVLVFFVLSGFVLTLPFLARRPTGVSVLAYYPRRIIRLYAPVWGAVALALALALLIPRPGTGSSWLQTHRPPSTGDVIHDLLLIFGTSNLDSPLWSLTWEVWFSLLMPLMFLLIRWMRADKWWMGAGTLLIGISVISRFPFVIHALPQAWLTAGMLQYLPIFGLGMLLAFNKDRLHATRSWGWALGAALLLTVSPSFAPNGTYSAPQAAMYALSLIGVVGIVALAFGSPLAVTLEHRIPQWAGKRSFSIYLTHEPIIVAAAILTGITSWWWLLVFIGLIPAILAVAELFYRVIELPAIRLSRATGRTILKTQKEAPARKTKLAKPGLQTIRPGE